MNLPKLLVVDDDLEFLNSQALALKSHFQIIPSEGVRHSLEVLKNESIDCALVDYYLNDGNGHDIAKWVTQHQPWCPVVLISAAMDKDIAINSFTHKIANILEKPYLIDHAVATLTAAIESFQHLKKTAAVPTQKSWELDNERRIFRLDQRSVALTQTEVRILEILIASKRTVVPRKSLIEALWGEHNVAENTLDTHLTNLRKKAPFLKPILKGVRGIGYVLDL